MIQKVYTGDEQELFNEKQLAVMDSMIADYVKCMKESGECTGNESDITPQFAWVLQKLAQSTVNIEVFAEALAHLEDQVTSLMDFIEEVGEQEKKLNA